VFADTGTYLSQAVHRYLGWDRPVFYSLAIFPLHGTRSTWPVPVAQAILVAWLLRLTRRVLAPDWPWWSDLAIAAALAIGTWLPFLAATVMPDVFTPLLVLALGLLAFAPAQLAPRERWALAGFAAFMIAAQQSSVMLYAALATAACALRHSLMRSRGMVSAPCLPPVRSPLPGRNVAAVPCGPLPAEGPGPGAWLAWLSARLRVRRPRPTTYLPAAPWVVAVLALASVNLIGHGRFALAPYGNVFLLARVIGDGPGRTALWRNCPQTGWRLCDHVERLPLTSDEFLWRADSPVMLAGGHKAVSAEARPIILAALRAEPWAELRAAAANVAEQLARFRSGDGLGPWPAEVTPWIRRDFPPSEQASYDAARQQRGALVLPVWLAALHCGVALAGVAACLLLLPRAARRRDISAGFLVLALLALPVSAAITGGLSTPHDRYQARVMWLPGFVAVLALGVARQRNRLSE
jgi:hypothetical protein